MFRCQITPVVCLKRAAFMNTSETYLVAAYHYYMHASGAARCPYPREDAGAGNTKLAVWVRGADVEYVIHSGTKTRE